MEDGFWIRRMSSRAAILCPLSQGLVHAQLLVEVSQTLIVCKGGVLRNEHLNIFDRIHNRAFHLKKLVQRVALLYEVSNCKGEL